MAKIVLRLHLTGGDRMDVAYEDPEVADPDQLLDHALSTLADDAGMLRVEHGERLVVVYGRGVAAVQVAPRGAVL